VKSLPILISTTERSDFSRSIDGKTHHGKASFAELKDADGFKSMLREMIFRRRENNVQCCFQKWILAILLGFVERFSERRWVKSLFIFMADGFGKSLETLL
jgi:phage terminase large subunit-like protein